MAHGSIAERNIGGASLVSEPWALSLEHWNSDEVRDESSDGELWMNSN